MRELTVNEMHWVAGGNTRRRTAHDCGGGSSNNYGGVSDTGSVGRDLINIYEGLVAATSHVIERIANAF